MGLFRGPRQPKEGAGNMAFFVQLITGYLLEPLDVFVRLPCLRSFFKKMGHSNVDPFPFTKTDAHELRHKQNTQRIYCTP